MYGVTSQISVCSGMCLVCLQASAARSMTRSLTTCWR